MKHRFKTKGLFFVLLATILVISLIFLVAAGSPGPAGPEGPPGPPGPPGTAGPSFEKPSAPQPAVEATYTTYAPSLDGVIDDVWDKTKALDVLLDGNFTQGKSTTGKSVSLKFLYDNKNIYMLAQWPDPTWSWSRGASWVWNGTSWHVLSGSAEAMEYGLVTGASEDRLVVIWPINVPEFEEKGCLTKCHMKWEGESVIPLHVERGVCETCHNDGRLEFPGAGAYFDNKTHVADMWHMKAARTLPLGYCDDKNVIYDAAPHKGDGGRHGDKGVGFYDHNRNKAKSAPAYIETNPKNYADALVITQSEIALGEAVLVANLKPSQVDTYWAKYKDITVPDGGSPVVVPERILKDMSVGLLPEEGRGSRADVLEAGRWNNGTWTCEFSRKLVTGHGDDVQFADFTKVYLFDVAAMDDTGGDGHSYHVGSPLHLVFAPSSR